MMYFVSQEQIYDDVEDVQTQPQVYEGDGLTARSLFDYEAGMNKTSTVGRMKS